jgi:hypothetical protein
LTALVVSVAVAFSSVGAASAGQGELAKPGQASGTRAPQQSSKNATPLPPGPAAGIQQAQGAAGANDWILIVGGIAISTGILVLVAGGGDEDSSPPTTGTN